jgi:hypothetical protein
LFKESPFRENSFETMYFNDFSPVSSCISNLNMASIGSLFSKKKPSLVLVSRMAWEIYKTEQQVGVDYKTLNEGYFESG